MRTAERRRGCSSRAASKRHAHVVANERAEHQRTFGRAFGEGLERHGWRVTYGSQPDRCDLLVIWGVRNREAVAAQKQAGGEVCILERGYVGDRFAWTSVSFGGGLNGRGIFRGPLNDGSRWERHFAHLMQPWQRRSGFVLLIGQVPGDMSLQGVNIDQWYARTAKACRAQGWDVRFRPHPVAIERGFRCAVDGVPSMNGNLYAALDQAAAVITWNSNTAVEAVLAGVPTIAMDRGSMAWDVTGHEIAPPPMPCREPWAHALAWKQWLREEMASGECWAAVGIV